MHHFFEAITNTAGDSLIGYFARVINRTTQNTVTLSSDENGTPIVVVSGVENMAKTDDYGNLSLYVDPGTYHLDIYAPNTTTFLYRVSDVAMNSTKGDAGPQGDQGPAGEGLEEVMAPNGAALVGYNGGNVSAALTTQSSKLAKVVYVTDPPYNAVGDGVTDDSAAIMACLNANKGGTIIFPQGKTFLAAGTIMSGSTYNNTKIIVQGTYKLKPSGGALNFGSATSKVWAGFVISDCDGVSIDAPGILHGNRANQTASQQHHMIAVWGASNWRIERANGVELRGDVVAVTSLTNVAPLTQNSVNGYIGPITAVNTVDDGRNAVSIISGENITLAGGSSTKVGGTINGERMPGGFDIECDTGGAHLAKNIRSGPWIVETAGTSGVAVIGGPITSDAARDWSVQNVWIAPSVVTLTSSAVGGPIFKRGRGVTAEVSLIRTGGRNAGVSIDFQDFSNIRAYAKGCSTAVAVGVENFVNDSTIHVDVEDHSGAGLLIIGANRTTFTGNVRGGQGAGSFGVQLSVGPRGTITQSSNTYSVNVPYDANNTLGFATSDSLTFSDGTCVANCAFNGYPNFVTMFGMTAFIRTRNVTGRNNGTAMPTTGGWTVGDFVANDSPVIATGKVLTGWARLTSGTAHVSGTDWTPVYSTVS